MVQTVATGVYSEIIQQYPFNNTRFQFRKEDDEIFLTISSVNKKDKAVYFCQSGTEFLQTFINGFLLLIKGNISTVDVIFSNNNIPFLMIQIQYFWALVSF